MSDQTESMLGELDRRLASVTSARRLVMLRDITDLLLRSEAAYSSEQVSLFDTVIERLSKGIAAKALAELSGRLAVVDSAPAETVSRLSDHDDIAISGPVLERSKALKDDDLVGIAQTKSQGHLLAIAGRSEINGFVTDVLVDRGDPAVNRKMLSNGGAHFSEMGFVRLIDEGSRDKAFANMIAKRGDVPEELQPFLKLALG
jgi:uncharacterized protein (DUF2336 family)